MGVNKVQYGGETLIDLTSDNVSPDKVFDGTTFHGADGNKKVGSFTLASEMSDQDNLIALIKAALSGKAAGGGGSGEIVEPTLQEKIVTPTKSKQDIVADAGYDGLYKVIVEAIPEEYIVPSDIFSITENGMYDIETYSSVDVNVPQTLPNIQPLTITESGTYTASNGVDGYSPITVDIIPSSDTSGDLMHGTLDGTITEIDSHVTKVIGYACRGITTLTTVRLPNATSIGTYAFYECSGLTTVEAGLVTSLGTYAFYKCSALTSVNFPYATSVPSSCFYQCTKLAKLDLGAAKSIGSSGLAYCTALKTIILRRSDAICTLNSSGFSGVSSLKASIYVPAALIEDYKAASNWSTYASLFKTIEDNPDVCG